MNSTYMLFYLNGTHPETIKKIYQPNATVLSITFNFMEFFFFLTPPGACFAAKEPDFILTLSTKIIKSVSFSVLAKLFTSPLTFMPFVISCVFIKLLFVISVKWLHA